MFNAANGPDASHVIRDAASATKSRRDQFLPTAKASVANYGAIGTSCLITFLLRADHDCATVLEKKPALWLSVLDLDVRGFPAACPRTRTLWTWLI